MIRNATPADAAHIAAIYAYHVLHGTASFETEPPTPAFWTAKINELNARNWPFIVAERDGAVTGYAYATQFRDRPAYAHTCENSIYIDNACRGSGIGTKLLNALIDASAAAGFREMIAVAGGGEPASVALHAKCGFTHAGRLQNVGRKFGRLLDTVYMQRSLPKPD
jgi:L-amino acid N-acyltransferase YncA